MDFEKVREWYILGTGLIFIVIIGIVGAYYAAPTSASSTAVESAAQSPQRAGSERAGTGTAGVGANSHRGTRCFCSADYCRRRAASHRPIKHLPRHPPPVRPLRTTMPWPRSRRLWPRTATPAAQSTGQATNQSASAPTLTADAEAGRLVYRKCQACHSLTPGKNGVGPSLAGIVGKKAGDVAGFNYSPAMKGEWSHLGCSHTRCLSDGPPEEGSRQQDAVSWTEDR